MKKFAIIIAGLGIAVSAVPASAQAWQNINSRQQNLDRRIDVGVRNGQLSRVEAQRLRNEFRGLARLEARYRSDGLSMRERTDLNRRFDVLSSKVRYERQDRNGRRY
jgi:hypothetical protein